MNTAPWDWFPERHLFGPYRTFLFYLTVADIKTRYRNAWLGWLWHLLQPLLLTVCYYLVFEKILGLAMAGAWNYPVFLVYGLLPWQFLSTGLTQGSLALERYSSWIFSTTAPRILFPASALLAALFYFVAQLLLAWLLLFPGHGRISNQLAWILPALAFAVLVGWNLTLILSLLHVRFKEIAYLLELTLMVWFLFSPVFYSPSILPPAWLPCYLLNPAALLLTLFRTAFSGHPPPLNPGTILLVLTGETLILFLFSRWLWRRLEKTVVDWL